MDGGPQYVMLQTDGQIDMLARGIKETKNSNNLNFTVTSNLFK